MYASRVTFEVAERALPLIKSSAYRASRVFATPLFRLNTNGIALDTYNVRIQASNRTLVPSIEGRFPTLFIAFLAALSLIPAGTIAAFVPAA